MSPGYRIKIEPHSGNVTGFQNEIPLALSDKVNVLRETRLPDCYYFPKEAIDREILEPSDRGKTCLLNENTYREKVEIKKNGRSSWSEDEVKLLKRLLPSGRARGIAR